jgi:hypothetical protein
LDAAFVDGAMKAETGCIAMKKASAPMIFIVVYYSKIDLFQVFSLVEL